MVQDLILSLPQVLTDSYMVVMFAALFSWAFYGSLRASEYTMPVVANHDLQVSDILKIETDEGPAYRIKFRSYKHSPDFIPDFIMVSTGHPVLCPVLLMDQYLRVRENVGEAMFMDHRGSVTRLELDNLLIDCFSLLKDDQDTWRGLARFRGDT